MMSIDKKQLTNDIITHLERSVINATEEGMITVVLYVDDAKALVEYHKEMQNPKPELQYTFIDGKLGREIYVMDPKDNGYTAYFKDFPKIVTQGDTIAKAQVNLWLATYDTLKFLMDNKTKI